MKHNKNHDNAQNTEPQIVPVHFEFSHPTAVAVCIAGTFNDWDPTSKPMRSSGAGHWWKETGLLPGSYEYCLVVDGEWMPDPSARETVGNPFGGRNSVLEVASSTDAAHRADASDLPMKSDN